MFIDTATFKRGCKSLDLIAALHLPPQGAWDVWAHGSYRSVAQDRRFGMTDGRGAGSFSVSAAGAQSMHQRALERGSGQAMHLDPVTRPLNCAGREGESDGARVYGQRESASKCQTRARATRRESNATASGVRFESGPSPVETRFERIGLFSRVCPPSWLCTHWLRVKHSPWAF